MGGKVKICHKLHSKRISGYHSLCHKIHTKEPLQLNDDIDNGDSVPVAIILLYSSYQIPTYLAERSFSRLPNTLPFPHGNEEWHFAQQLLHFGFTADMQPVAGKAHLTHGQLFLNWCHNFFVICHRLIEAVLWCGFYGTANGTQKSSSNAIYDKF
jgi:hypothetical protein